MTRTSPELAPTRNSLHYTVEIFATDMLISLNCSKSRDQVHLKIQKIAIPFICKHQIQASRKALDKTKFTFSEYLNIRKIQGPISKINLIGSLCN